MCYGARSMKFTFQQEDKTMTAQEAYNDLMEEILNMTRTLHMNYVP